MGLLREASSREKRVSLVYALVAVLSVLFYLVLFPRPIPPELTLVPQQAIALTETPGAKLSPSGEFFTLGAWEGYWNPEGSMERVQALRPQATASGNRIAWYDAPHNQVVVEGPGGVLFNLSGERFPTWAHGRLFTLDENRMGLKAFDPQGRVQWVKQFSSLITALDTSDALTVVGTLDGKVRLFNLKGDPVGDFQPGGSRLSVIYNVSVSPSNSQVLVLAGVDPKRFLILDRGGSEFRPIFHKPLKENRPWPTPLGFLGGGRLAYYETDRGVAFLDPQEPSREILLSTEGSPVGIESLPGERLLVLVQRDGDRAALRLASTEGAALLTLPFSAQEILLKRRGNALLLGIDQTLLRLEVRIQ